MLLDSRRPPRPGALDPVSGCWWPPTERALGPPRLNFLQHTYAVARTPAIGHTPYRDHERFDGIILHIERGEAWQVISAIESAHDIDLIVMGTIERTNIPGFFIGTTAETVLRQVNCSVLTVKPDQFVSPIKIEDQVIYA